MNVLNEMTQNQIIQLQSILTAAHNDYENTLKAYSFFKIHDRATCEDLVQETFLKTWSYLMKGGKIRAMKSFLYHVLNNLIVDQYRKRQTSSLDVLIEKGFEPSEDNTERQSNIFDGKKVIQLLKRLPKKYKKIMEMRYMRDLSLEEISKITKQSKNTVAVQTHRGLEKLKPIFHLRTSHSLLFFLGISSMCFW